MKIGIIYFCGVQVNKRHLFDNHLQIIKDGNPLFFQNLNEFGTNNLSPYLFNIIKTKEHWDQIIKELKDFGANNDIIICIGENNSKYLPRCLGNNWFKKLKICKSEWYSKFAIQQDYSKYLKQNFSEFFIKKD